MNNDDWCLAIIKAQYGFPVQECDANEDEKRTNAWPQ